MLKAQKGNGLMLQHQTVVESHLSNQGVVTGLGDRRFIRAYRKKHLYSRQLQFFLNELLMISPDKKVDL